MNRYSEGNTHNAAMTPLGTTLPGNMIPLARQAGIETLLAGKLPVAANSWGRAVSMARPSCVTEAGRGKRARHALVGERRQRRAGSTETRASSSRSGREGDGEGYGQAALGVRQNQDKAHVRRLLQ